MRFSFKTYDYKILSALVILNKSEIIIAMSRFYDHKTYISIRQYLLKVFPPGVRHFRRTRLVFVEDTFVVVGRVSSKAKLVFVEL